MKTKTQLIDHLVYAAQICQGKRVLDIGGQHPLNHDPKHPFGLSYRRIAQNASQYESFDKDIKLNVKYTGDLNTADGRDLFARTLEDYQPQVMLCMEILEHLNHPHAVMNILAMYLSKTKWGRCVFITIPNNGNWILNALGWNKDHNVSFFKGTAARFVERSDLGAFPIVMIPCMQKYKWYWWIIYLLSFGQPFSWGFAICHSSMAAEQRSSL